MNWPGTDSLCVTQVSAHSISTYDMAQKGNLPLEQNTFLWVNVKLADRSHSKMSHGHLLTSSNDLVCKLTNLSNVAGTLQRPKGITLN